MQALVRELLNYLALTSVFLRPLYHVYIHVICYCDYIYTLCMRCVLYYDLIANY